MIPTNFFKDMERILDEAFGSVNIGVGEKISADARHGVAFVRQGNVLRTVSFIADKPYRLTSPSTDDIRGLFEQLVQMEFVPVSVELMLPSCQSVIYRVKDLHPEIANHFGIEY